MIITFEKLKLGYNFKARKCMHIKISVNLIPHANL